MRLYFLRSFASLINANATLYRFIFFCFFQQDVQHNIFLCSRISSIAGDINKLMNDLCEIPGFELIMYSMTSFHHRIGNTGRYIISRVSSLDGPDLDKLPKMHYFPFEDLYIRRKSFWLHQKSTTFQWIKCKKAVFWQQVFFQQSSFVPELVNLYQE